MNVTTVIHEVVCLRSFVKPWNVSFYFTYSKSLMEVASRRFSHSRTVCSIHETIASICRLLFYVLTGPKSNPRFVYLVHKTMKPALFGCLIHKTMEPNLI